MARPAPTITGRTSLTKEVSFIVLSRRARPTLPPLLHLPPPAARRRQRPPTPDPTPQRASAARNFACLAITDEGLFPHYFTWRYAAGHYTFPILISAAKFSFSSVPPYFFLRPSLVKCVIHLIICLYLSLLMSLRNYSAPLLLPPQLAAFKWTTLEQQPDFLRNINYYVAGTLNSFTVFTFHQIRKSFAFSSYFYRYQSIPL
jgi:hypothetical protein